LLESLKPLPRTDSRPNIIWIVSQDREPDLECWGTAEHAPNIDRLADDSHELKNLASDPAMAETRREFRNRLEERTEAVRRLGIRTAGKKE